MGKAGIFGTAILAAAMFAGSGAVHADEAKDIAKAKAASKIEVLAKAKEKGERELCEQTPDAAMCVWQE